MSRLTPQQNSMIENSLWVVNTALKNQGLEVSPNVEDLRQSAILYMCKCINNFDPSRNIKWTTYAYKNVYLYIKRLQRREIKRSSWEISGEATYCSQDQEMPIEQAGVLDENKLVIEKIKSKCSKREREVIDLKLQGYKGTEISKKMGCSISKVSMYMRNIKDIARNNYF